MNKRIVLLAVALALTIVWVGFSFVQSLRPTAPVITAAANSPVADFALKDESGQIHHLSDFKGKVVALVFYASW